MKIKEIYNVYCGQYVEFTQVKYSSSSTVKILSGYIVGIEDINILEKDVKDAWFINIWVRTDENYLVRGFLKNWSCDSYECYVKIVPNVKKLSKRKIKEYYENAISFKDWFFYDKNNKKYLEFSGEDCDGDKYLLGFEDDYSYKYEKNRIIYSKCIRKNNPDFLNKKITIINRIKNDGTSIEDNILMYHEYDVCDYEVENNEVIGYYVKHNESVVYIPKECLFESEVKNSSFEKLIIEYRNSLNPVLDNQIKDLMVNNFKNEYEINILKIKNEINNIRFYHNDNTIRLITENIEDLNTKTKQLHKLINNNYLDLNKKIDNVEVKLTKYIDNITDNLQKQITENYQKANNYRLFGLWVTTENISKLRSEGLEAMLNNHIKEESLVLSKDEYKATLEDLANRINHVPIHPKHYVVNGDVYNF